MQRKPTPEQQDGVEKFLTRKPMRVRAYAGCGKTTMLEMLGRATPRRGSYICFNADGAKEGKDRFAGTNVEASTTHGLAFRTLVKTYGTEKMTGGLNGGFLASRMRLSSIALGEGVITPRGHGRLLIETVKRWCSSDRPEIGPWDVPLTGKLEGMSPPDARRLQQQIAAKAAELWHRMSDRDDELPLTHDGYLKLWALSKPTIPGEFIFLDEAQDSSGVVLGVLKHQSAQLIAVGDQHQQIYEWRGAVNAMTQLACEVEARLTTSWRFGPRIAEHASEILKLLGETVPLKGNPAKNDKLGALEAPQCILSRTNSRLIQAVMDEVAAGRRPFVLGGVGEIVSFVEAAEKLMGGQPVERPLEFFGFNNWREVVNASEEDGGEDLRRWVRLVDDYGTAELRRILEGLPKRKDQGDLTISTGHKSKGKEWDSVTVLDGFLRGVKPAAKIAEERAAFEALGKPYTPPPPPDEELRLLYVAATRGRDALDMAPVVTEKLIELGARVAPPAQPSQPAAEPATVAPPQAAAEGQEGAPRRKSTRITKAQKAFLKSLLEREAATGSEQARTILDNF